MGLALGFYLKLNIEGNHFSRGMRIIIRTDSEADKRTIKIPGLFRSSTFKPPALSCHIDIWACTKAMKHQYVKGNAA